MECSFSERFANEAPKTDRRVTRKTPLRGPTNGWVRDCLKSPGRPQSRRYKAAEMGSRTRISLLWAPKWRLQGLLQTLFRRFLRNRLKRDSDAATR